MTTANANLIRVPSVSLALAIVGATTVLGALGAAACWLAGVTPAASGAMGLIAALAGATVGVTPWLLRHEVPVFTAATTQLLAAGLRMIIGLAAAVGLLLATDADRAWLLGVFLAATVAGLAAELLVLTPVLKAVPSPANTPTPPMTPPAPNTPETAG